MSFSTSGKRAFAPTAGTYTRVLDVRLKDPLNVGKTAEQYLAESILRPDTYVIPGALTEFMPRNFGEEISLQQLRDLVAYMMAQK